MITFDGAACRDLRRSRAWHQATLAAKLGVSVYTVSRWESGVFQPSFKHLDALAKALDVNIRDLIIIE